MNRLRNFVLSRPRLKWFFCDGSGRIVIAQSPNPPLIIWLVLQLAAIITSWVQPSLHTFFAIAASLALAYWAILEIFWGVCPWRKMLGLAIYTIVITSLIHRII